jgi:hypothetical protein
VKVLHDDVFRRLCRARDLVHERCAEPLTVARGVEFVSEPKERPYGIEAR